MRGARSCSIAMGALGLASACGSGGGARTPADAGSADLSAPNPVQLTGCPATPNEPVAPGGYYVNGNTICTAEAALTSFTASIARLSNGRAAGRISRSRTSA